jgi:hypothetical protein
LELMYLIASSTLSIATIGNTGPKTSLVKQELGPILLRKRRHLLAHQRIVERDIFHDRWRNVFLALFSLSARDDGTLSLVQKAPDADKVGVSDDTPKGRRGVCSLGEERFISLWQNETNENEDRRNQLLTASLTHRQTIFGSVLG